MVALRERRSRPSYADINEGLAGLSEAASDKEAVSGSGSPPGSRTRHHGPAAESPISSGNSSEFKPSAEEGSDTNAKRSKTSRAAASADSDGSPGASTAEDEDVAEDSPLQEYDEKLEVRATKPRIKQKQRSGPSRGTASVYFHQPSSAAPLISNQTATNLLPPAYREVVRVFSHMITKGSTGFAGDAETRSKGLDKLRQARAEALPLGPPVPFVTKLQAPPKRRGENAVKVVREEGERAVWRATRQKAAWQIPYRVPLLAPWQTWEGEGWWPEMFRGLEPIAGGSKGSGARKGKSKATAERNWVLREEVSLGLEDIGRLPAERIQVLSEAEAEPFLPTMLDARGNPWITCHVGPLESQTPARFGLFDSKSLEDCGWSKEGFVSSAGGPIWGLDWCPYPDTQSASLDYVQFLAVSTTPHIDTRLSLGEQWPSSSPSSIEIWSVTAGGDPEPDLRPEGSDRNGQMRCELILCVGGGAAMELKWMPLGAWNPLDTSEALPKIGIIAAVQLDGSVSLYPVPNPYVLRGRVDTRADPSRPIYIRLNEPLLKIELPGAMCLCLDWMTGTKLAVGLSNGHGVVFDVGEALREGHQSEVLPSVYMSLSLCAIKSVAAGRCPQANSEGDIEYGYDPVHLVFGSFDGETILVDIRDWANPMVINRARTPTMAVGWASHMAAPLYVDVDYILNIQNTRGEDAGRSFLLAVHRGAVWQLATSDYHLMAAMASSDGAVIISNYNLGFRRRRKMPMVTQRMYEMDYDQHTGEYRMLDHFMPESMGIEDAVGRTLTNPKKRGKVKEALVKLSNWDAHVGIHRVAWQNGAGLGRAGWLASGGASGLLRIEWVEGRFRAGMLMPEALR